MQLKTILNRVLRHSAFVYVAERLMETLTGPTVEVHVLDRFHIMAHLSKAIDEVRASEAKALKDGGYEPVLKDSRWLLLKRPENVSERQEIRLAELVQYNLKSVRAYLLKEDFQFFWGYKSWYWCPLACRWVRFRLGVWGEAPPLGPLPATMCSFKLCEVWHLPLPDVALLARMRGSEENANFT